MGHVCIHCRACQMSNPINGIVGSIRCYHCGDVNPLDQAFWNAAIPVRPADYLVYAP